MKHPNWNQAFEKAPESFHTRMVAVLDALPEQEKQSMKPIRTIKRTVLLAAAAALLLCGAVFAGTRVGYIRSDWRNSYTLKDAADVGEAMKAVEGIAPDARFLEQYSNGFVFSEGTVDGAEARNPDDPTVYRYQSIDAAYERDGETVHVAISPLISGVTTEQRGEPVSWNGVTLYTLEQDYKVVNQDYVKTDAEQRLEEAGQLIFSYDDSLSEPEQFQQRYVSWIEDQMRYSIYTSDTSSQADIPELVQMARELMGGE